MATLLKALMPLLLLLLNHRAHAKTHTLPPQPAGPYDFNQTKHPGYESFDLQIHASNNWIIATQWGRVAVMSQITHDGTWSFLSGTVKTAAITDDGTMFGITATGGIYRRLPADTQWTKIDNGDSTANTIRVTPDGSVLVVDGTNGLRRADNPITQTPLAFSWTKVEGTHGGFTPTISDLKNSFDLNADATIICGIQPTYNQPGRHQGFEYYKRVISMETTNMQLPTGAGDPIQFALGKPTGSDAKIYGKHDLWMLDTNNNLYHAWVEPISVARTQGWVKVAGKLMQMSAVESGILYGTSVDGYGILYCGERNYVAHEYTCEYIIGPLGLPPASTV